MTIQENVPLAPLTTLGVGGAARFFAVAESVEEVEEALAFARERSLPLFVLGEGSNVLIPDEGISGVVLKMAVRGITVEDRGDRAVLVAGAGALWDDVVDAASAHHLFGIENLAGIPGSVAGAAVQNIGAYGAELSRVFDAADVVDSETGTRTQIARDAAAFAYRTSFFKQHPRFCISRVTFALTKDAEPDLSYADVARARAAGAPLATPAEIARTIRAIRAKKFPQDEGEGTAGSFFKNPVIPRAHAEALAGRFPGLPTFPREDGRAKVSLAWLLDHALSLKGYAEGPVRLYEEQPLVIVVRSGATAAAVDAFARAVAARVHDATGIAIEREVETFGVRS